MLAMKRTHNRLLLLLLAGLSISVFIGSCKKIEIVESTTDDVNIYGYLEKYPDKYSSFKTIIDKAGYSGFLNAYGLYTFFAPTNDGVQKYLQLTGKTSADQFTEEEAKNIVKLHVIQDTITTGAFKDGKLPLVTMYGQYLVTGVAFENGVSSYLINRQAKVSQSNIKTANGIIHTVDNVLQPATLTVAKIIEQNADYSIFTQALKETGYYDSLNINNNPDTWLTVLAESNQALLDSNITSYAQLKTKYSQTNDPKNVTDSLHLYVAYHILLDAKYLADIISGPSHTTLAPLEVVTSRLDGQTVLINDVDFNGTHEQGITLERAASDISATNGVIHKATSHFTIKVRKPVPVYWDISDFPEIRKLPAYFRKQQYVFQYGSIKDITWEKGSITYAYSTSSSFPMFNNDYMVIPLGTASARNLWCELRTPLLVKGRYKVWICYRQQSASGGDAASNPIQVSFNGEPLPRLLNCAGLSAKVPAGTPGELEALGWKYYTDVVSNLYPGRLIGIIDVPITDRHVIRLQGTNGGQNTNNLDMIHLIPVNENQIRPVFKRDGTLIQ
jgi:uncharacterized surface protein with fasciclin (FAS1) repeats